MIKSQPLSWDLTLTVRLASCFTLTFRSHVPFLPFALIFPYLQPSLFSWLCSRTIWLRPYSLCQYPEPQHANFTSFATSIVNVRTACQIVKIKKHRTHVLNITKLSLHPKVV